LDEAAANPDVTGANASALVIQYDREPNQFTDRIPVNANNPVLDVQPYIDGTEVMTIDVFAPAGTAGDTIFLRLYNRDTFTVRNALGVAGDGASFDLAAHSTFTGEIPADGQWVTITFEFERVNNPNVLTTEIEAAYIGLDHPSLNTPTASASTWYFDNFYGPEQQGCSCDLTVGIEKLSDITCTNSVVSLDAAVGTTSSDPISTYAWSAGVLTDDGSGIATVDAAGVYTVTVTVDASCEVTASVEVLNVCSTPACNYDDAEGGSIVAYGGPAGTLTEAVANPDAEFSDTRCNTIFKWNKFHHIRCIVTRSRSNSKSSNRECDSSRRWKYVPCRSYRRIYSGYSD